MNARFLRLPLLAAAFAGGAVLASERSERHSFPVEPGCTLKIDSYRGSVIVTESDEPRVQLLIQMEIGTEKEEEADQMRAALQLAVKADQNVVAVQARNPAETRVRWIWNENRQIDLTYRVTVPRSCHLDLKVKNGSITVGATEGRIRAALENGSVTLKYVGGSADVLIGQGDLLVSRCLGPLTAKLQQGTIRTGLVGGPLQLFTGGGEIEVMEARGTVQANCEAGDLRIGFPRRIGGAVRLEANGGNVVARLDPASSCWIEAVSVWGDVTTKLPLVYESGASGKSRLTGRLNTGGPSLTIRASGGHVKLESGAALFD